MNLTRPLPRPGMGIMTFTDTGAGIRPVNFEANCCGGALSWFGYLSSDDCYGFYNANKALFGEGHGPCSTEGLMNLKTRGAVSSMAPIEVPPKTLDDPNPPGTELWSFPYSDATPACNGQKVITEQDAALFQTCLAQRQAAAQAAAVMAAMTSNAADQCAAIKVECKNKTFAAFMSPSEDCTECVFDWLKPGSMFLVAGGLLVGGLILVKLLK